MRTTLTLDDDLARRLADVAHQKKTSFKQAVNETIRRGLMAGEKPASRKRFRVEARACGFRRGIDPLHLNRLVDELEIEAEPRPKRRR